MAEGFIVRKAGGGATTEAPTINVTEETNILKFTLTNNDDNTAFITYKIDTLFDTVELTSGATSSEITIDTLPVGTYTLEAYATVVGEVVTSDTVGITLELTTYELIADVEVTSNTTQIDFDNLNITKDDELRLVVSVFNQDSGTGNYDLYVNNNTTSNNYWSQALRGNSSSVDAFRVNDAELFYVSSMLKGLAIIDIKISNNDKFVAQSNQTRNIPASSLGIDSRNMVSTFNLTSITSLSFACLNRTNGIGVGSRLQLYKVNKGVA